MEFYEDVDRGGCSWRLVESGKVPYGWNDSARSSMVMYFA